jgi:hypothetical protein
MRAKVATVLRLWFGFQNGFNDAEDGAIMNVFRRIPELLIRIIMKVCSKHQTQFLVLRKVATICKVLILQDAPVAQLDRAFDYESKGRKFESCRAHHLNLLNSSSYAFLFFLLTLKICHFNCFL